MSAVRRDDAPARTPAADGGLPLTLPARVAHFAQVRPDAPALRQKRLGIWRELTWREYRDAVAETARGLWTLGVRPGDAVAILSDNRIEWLFADLGAQAIGARSVGIYQTNPAPDVAYVLQDARVKVLFCEDQEQVDKAVAVRGETPAVEHVIVFEPRGTRSLGDERLRAWDDVVAEGRRLLAGEPGWFEARLAELDPDAPAMVVYTSGTTGPPKGAMLSSRNALGTSLETTAFMGVGPHDTLLSYLPLCHVAEKIFTLYLPLTAGALVHFGEAIETVQTDLREVSPTIFLGVPRIWEKMHAAVTVRLKNSSWLKRTLAQFFLAKGPALARARREGRLGPGGRALWTIGCLLVYWPLRERLGLRRCRRALSGAAPIGVDLLSWFHGMGVDVYEGYGMTECAGVSHANPPGGHRLGTVGVPLPGVEQRLAEDGEVLVRGPNVFLGYLGRPDATREAIDAEGWLHTGDVGSIDADGYLTITGRKKEILITAGGKNLSPEKIENALKTSPYVKEAIAIGDSRPFVSALVQVDLETVGDWAARRGIAYTSYADLVARPEVVQLVAGELEQANERLARVEQVRAFRLLPKELTQDDGEMTATQKVRRKAVHQGYAELIEQMYARGSA